MLYMPHVRACELGRLLYRGFQEAGEEYFACMSTTRSSAVLAANSWTSAVYHAIYVRCVNSRRLLPISAATGHTLLRKIRPLLHGCA